MDLRRLRALIKTLKASGVSEYQETKEGGVRLRFAPAEGKEAKTQAYPIPLTEEAKEEAIASPESLEDILYWSSEQ